MKFFKQNFVPIIFLFILSTIPLLWFKDNCIIAGGDANQYMAPLKFAKNHQYYLTYENMGQYNNGWNSMLPSMGIFWLFFSHLGLEDCLTQKLWFIFLWFFSMLGIYLLIKEITKNSFSKIGGVLGSCLYIINIFVGQLALNVQISLPLLTLPYLMLFVIRAVRDIKSENLNSLCFGIVFIFAVPALSHPGYGYILFLFPILYILFDLFSNFNLKSIFIRLRLTIKILFFSALSSSFFLLPYIHNAKTFFAATVSSIKGGFFSSNSLQESFRFLASWAFRGCHYKIPYSPWSGKYYDSPLVVFATFFIPIMVFAGLLFLKKFKKITLFFCLTSFLGIFLSKGIGQPCGNIYQWLFDHIPLFSAFREAWSKFTQITVFSFSVLLGLGFTEMKQAILNNKLRKLVISVTGGATFLCILIAGFPIFTSEIFSAYWNGSAKGNYIKIPGHWTRIAKYLKSEDPDTAIFLTPRSKYCIYEWDMGVSTMGNIPTLLLHNQIIKYEDNYSAPSHDLLSLTYKLIEPSNSYKFSKLLKLMGVKYVLQQNDMDWRFLSPYTYPPTIMDDILKEEPGLKKTFSTGKLDLYKVNNGFFLPAIYIPDNISLVYGSVKDLPILLFTDILDKSPLIIFNNDIASDEIETIQGLSNNVAVDAGKNILNNSGKNVFRFHNFNDITNATPFMNIPRGTYNLELAFEPVKQKEILFSSKDLKLSAKQLNATGIAFTQFDFLHPEQTLPIFSPKPILANWEYDTFFYQPKEKKLVLDNLNESSINIDICLRFEYYWKGLVTLSNWQDNVLIAQESLTQFGDYIEINNITVKPGKNIFKVMCIPDKCIKNWPGEKVNVKRDIAIRLTNSEQPMGDKPFNNNGLILDTDYNLTVFNGIKQVDLLCYLNSNNDRNADAWMQITIDDWLMGGDFSHFKIDLIKAMEERFNNVNYKILAMNMVCYPSRGGSERTDKGGIEGDIVLRDFSLTHFYKPDYTFYSDYLKNNFASLNPLKNIKYSAIKQISENKCLPIITETKIDISENGKIDISKIENNYLDLKWLLLNPINKSNIPDKPFNNVESIRKINPVMYHTEISAGKPCFIVFSQNYHPGWKAFVVNKERAFMEGSVLLAYLKNKLLNSKAIPYHIKANGYANAWYLNQDLIEELKNGNRKIAIYFYPQILQELGMLISFLFLICALFYVIALKRRVS